MLPSPELPLCWGSRNNFSKDLFSVCLWILHVINLICSLSDDGSMDYGLRLDWMLLLWGRTEWGIKTNWRRIWVFLTKALDSAMTSAGMLAGDFFVRCNRRCWDEREVVGEFYGLSLNRMSFCKAHQLSRLQGPDEQDAVPLYDLLLFYYLADAFDNVDRIILIQLTGGFDYW